MNSDQARLALLAGASAEAVGEFMADKKRPPLSPDQIEGISDALADALLADFEWFQTAEVARMFGVSSTTIRAWELKGKFVPSQRTERGTRLYYKKDIEAFRERLRAARK